MTIVLITLATYDIMFLSIAVIVEVGIPLKVDIGGSAILVCEVYGYLRNSMQPQWTFMDDILPNNDNMGILYENSFPDSTTGRLKSYLAIITVSEENFGDYTCSVEGNSSSVTLRRGKFRHTCIHAFSYFELKCVQHTYIASYIR